MQCLTTAEYGAVVLLVIIGNHYVPRFSIVSCSTVPISSVSANLKH